MARRLRLQFPGAIYHLLSRGDRREDIFADDADRERFLVTLGEACAKTSWQVHAFCLMRNHVHLVVETPEANLVAGMKWLLSTYTMRFNRRHLLTGHLFSGRYKSLLVGGEGGYLRAVSEYVHLNPCRANALKPEEPLREYRWSSFPMYLAAQRPAWLKVQRVFGECGIPQDTAAGRKEFERRVELLRAGDGSTDLDAIRRDWCVGDDEFRSQLLAQMHSRPGAYHYGHELHEAAEEKAERMIREELERLGWSEAELRERRKGDPAKLAIAQRVRRETTMTLRWLAARLCMGTRAHLAHLLYWDGRPKTQRAVVGRSTPERASRRRSGSETNPPPAATKSGELPKPGTVSGIDRGFAAQPSNEVAESEPRLLGTDSGFDTSFD